MTEKTFLAFGEIVWDMLPEGKKLGGAPLNFSYYFQKAGGNPILVSGIGKDVLGRDALENMRTLGIDTQYVREVDYPTGRVDIILMGKEPSFNVIRGTAWEDIPYPGDKAVKESSGIYLGTLSRISLQNKNVLDQIMKKMKSKFICLDLNLRPLFYNREDIASLLTKVTHLKLNEIEAMTLKKEGFAKGKDEEEILKYLLENYNLSACCITLGDKGVIGGNTKEIIRVKGILSGLEGDNVGCGDAFTGTWIASLLKGKSMIESMTSANKIASKVASQRGAIISL